MPVFLLKNEKKLADVVTRVFGEVRAADRRRVEAALVRANPHLVDDDGIRPGIGVLVPPVPGLQSQPPGREETPDEEAIADLAGELEKYHHELEVAARQEKAELTALVTLYKSKELQQAVHDLPEASDQVRKVVAATKGRIETHKATEETIKHLNRAVAVLKGLGETLT